jgi:hypothetical protein
MKKFNNVPQSSLIEKETLCNLHTSSVKKNYDQENEIGSKCSPPATTEVNEKSEIGYKENLSHLKSKTMGRRQSTKDRERSLKRQASSAEKKTRWLLTRKTWRYMADAGRKLIPDGVSNKPENLARIEDHFQKLCANEKKFLIWKRKLSYPGACSSFRRKNKTKVSKKPASSFGSPTTGSSADECDDERSARSKRSDELIIKMLERYLSIGSDIEECESEQTLIGSNKSNNKDQNNNKMTISQSKYGDNNETLDFSKSAVLDQSIWHPSNFNESMHSSLLLDTLIQYRKKNYSPYIDVEDISDDLLKDRVLLRKILNDIRTQQKYAKIPRTESTRSLNISYSSSMSSLTSTISSTFHNFVDYIDNKTNTCRNSLYRQPVSTPENSTSTSGIYPSEAYRKIESNKLSESPSLTSLSRTNEIYNQQKQIFATKQQQQLYQHQQQLYHQKHQQLRSSSMKTSSMLKSITTKTTNTTTTLSSTKQQQRIHTTSETQSTSLVAPAAATSAIANKNVPLIAVKTASCEKILRENGTQTDGIPLVQLNQIYQEYKKKIEEEKQLEEEEFGPNEGVAPQQSKTNRKSSIDNKDVSQSVSDTIKRYLNMARKKPKDNDAANRFKRVNYDRNLRNIKAKGEITKPGDDDGLMKGCQTEDNWLEILFRNPRELDRCCTSPIFSPISSPEYKSPPTSPTSPPLSLPSSPPSPSTSSGIGSGILHSSTQFLSNLLWHHTNSSNQNIVNESAITMQKSKSSSNVGHLVSKKIFRSRSKSQTRVQGSPILTPSLGHSKPLWTPQVSLYTYFLLH